MNCVLRTFLVPVIVMVLAIASTPATAEQLSIPKGLLSFRMPSEMPAVAPNAAVDESTVDTILETLFDESYVVPDRPLAFDAGYVYEPNRGADEENAGNGASELRDFPARYPGRALDDFIERWKRLASVKPIIAEKNSAEQWGFGKGAHLAEVGDLPGRPGKLYSGFEIRVNRSNFTLRLYALKGQDRELLFESKVGLGSAEYPTPRGTYYILRVFDDNPMWIPPRDRLWAWGQVPSNSVYGGHMMPFFSKRTIRGSGPDDPGLDKIEPKRELVDGGMYRIHGTNSPWSVGSGQSHGCVRMLNKSVKKLADTLKLYAGTTERGRTQNGSYISLARPVKLVLYN